MTFFLWIITSQFLLVGQLGITPEVYISNMRAGLDILYNNIPRAFVNLVQVMDVGLTQTLQQGLISTVVLR